MRVEIWLAALATLSGGAGRASVAAAQALVGPTVVSPVSGCRVADSAGPYFLVYDIARGVPRAVRADTLWLGQEALDTVTVVVSPSAERVDSTVVFAWLAPAGPSPDTDIMLALDSLGSWHRVPAARLRRAGHITAGEPLGTIDVEALLGWGGFPDRQVTRLAVLTWRGTVCARAVLEVVIPV